VSATTPALLAAAAGVAVGHAILPDHWVPLAVVGRTHRYTLRRVAKLSTAAAIAHVLVSLVLGGIIVAVGLQFRSDIQAAQDTVIGTVLIVTGLAFVALELTGRGHRHAHGHDDGEHHHEHVHDGAQAPSRTRALAAIMVPFGAAASPDLTILPVFLAAATAGVATAISSLVTFAVVTIGTIVGLTLLACFGGYQIHGQWLERWGNVFTALVLLVIGALVLTSII
jgi:nickel/cobalt transporter (NicO) family protein